MKTNPFSDLKRNWN